MKTKSYIYIYIYTYIYIYIYIFTHSHTMKYYSAIKMNAILPSAAACMYLEGIMLSKISPKKTNTV